MAYRSSSRLLNVCSTEPVNAKSVFLQPQELSLRLRPGVRQSFPLTIAMPTDQPITELTIDTSDLPVGVNITFSNIQRGNPLVVEVSKIKHVYIVQDIRKQKLLITIICPLSR